MSDESKPEGEQPKIIIDEGWKEQVEAEREALKKQDDAGGQAGGADESAASGPPPQMPPADFTGLLTLMATQASMALSPGQTEDGQEVPPTPEMAKFYIDLIGVLEEKTAGNLTPDESKMLSGLLHELRMAFVAVKQNAG